MGTFAEYLAVFAPGLVKLPDTIGDHEASLACGGLTAYGAVKRLLEHHVLPGRPVAVIGAAGGLGHYGVQIARAFGYRVVAVDIGAERLDFARSLGASIAVEADGARRGARRVRWRRASLVFSAKMAGFRLGFDLLGPGGCSWRSASATSEGNIEFNPFQLFARTPRSSTPRSAPSKTCASSSISSPRNGHEPRVAHGAVVGARRDLRRPRSQSLPRCGAHRPELVVGASSHDLP